MRPLRTSMAMAMFATALFAAAPAPVQSDADGQPTMSVNPDPLQSGSSATITYSDPSRAGETITVDIDNGMSRNLITTSVTITLDANGEGSTTWEVPSWMVANFNAPGVAEVSLPVL